MPVKDPSDNVLYALNRRQDKDWLFHTFSITSRKIVIEKRYDLPSRTGLFGTESICARSTGNPSLNSPRNGLRIIGIGRYIDKIRAAVDGRAA